MDSLIFHNDRIVPLAEARLSPAQMGLFFGWGVFTTLRLYRGHPFAFERHWARMMRDSERLKVPADYSENAVRKAVEELAKANRRAEGMARVTILRNSGGMWGAAEGHPPADLLILTRELTRWPAAQKLVLMPNGIFAAGRLAGAKMLSWVPHAATLEKAVADGFDDALLLNEKGQLAECTSANIFIVRRGEALTPPLTSGCLPGVTREILLDIAPRAGIPAREAELTQRDLSSADEVFITSTTREVAPIESISPQWKFRAPGDLTQRLEKIFTEYVQSHLARGAQGAA